MVGSAGLPRFYYERQNGGLCRMHALNAFFGGPRLTPVSFETAMREYDTLQSGRFPDHVPSSIVDITTGDQKNIIAYILAKVGIFVRIYDSRHRAAAVAKAEQYGVVFMFTPDHVWLAKKAGAAWFKLDSGITSVTSEFSDPRIGLMVPCSRLSTEFMEISGDLENLVGQDIVAYLISELEAGNVLGNAETLIGSAVSILRIQLVGRSTYWPMDELFAWYDDFAHQFHGGNCGSKKFILTHVPKIILRILQIRRISKGSISSAAH